MKKARHLYAVITVVVMMGLFLLPICQMLLHFLPEKEVAAGFRGFKLKLFERYR